MNVQSVLEKLYQGRMLVFGHRGASAYAPMNTLPAFELAAQQGAHGIELDVQRSKDGSPVIVHDFTVDKTTNGSGRVDEMTLAQLKELDAGNWFGDAFRGVKIPTLDEVFEAVGSRLFINVEIKSESETTDGVEQVVANCIARHAMSERVIVSSFNPHALRRFYQIMPQVPIGFLHMPDIESATFAVLRDVPHQARHPYHVMIDAVYAASTKAQGYYINTWTINDPDRAIALQQLGVDMVITDKPDVILAALGI